MRNKFLLLLIALLAVTSAEGNDACQADFDGNGVVDFADFLLFNTLYGQRGGEQCAATVDADSLAVVTTLRDSITALQAALGATRFAVATLQATTTELQNALASETERANENKRLLTASNDAFNSLAQTRCPESEPAAQPEPEPPVVIEPPPEPEPPVVIETQPPPQPPPEPAPTPSLSFEVTLVETNDHNSVYDVKVFLNGLSKPIEAALVEPATFGPWPSCVLTPPPGGVFIHGDEEKGIRFPSPTWKETQQHIANLRCTRFDRMRRGPLRVAVSYVYDDYDEFWKDVRGIAVE